MPFMLNNLPQRQYFFIKINMSYSFELALISNFEPVYLYFNLASVEPNQQLYIFLLKKAKIIKQLFEIINVKIGKRRNHALRSRRKIYKNKKYSITIRNVNYKNKPSNSFKL